MRYMATIYVSDVMDQVALTVEVQEWANQFGAPETSLRATYVWPGVGAGSPSEWLGMALFLASEEISKAAREGSRAASPIGGHNTISGSGDTQI